MAHRISSLLLVAVVFAAGAVAMVGWYRTYTPAPVALAEATVPAPAPQESSANVVKVSEIAPTSTPPTPEVVTHWIADTGSGDAQKRAAAITALADAPRARALPVLARLLTDGEPQFDRRLALHSLRELGLSQGDADGAVRDAVRHAIYHGDDFTPASEAQEVLEILEESETK